MAESAYVSWKITLPRIVANAVEARIQDPFTGRPQYGYRSRLIVAMLQTWLSNPTNRDKVQQTLAQLEGKDDDNGNASTNK